MTTIVLVLVATVVEEGDEKVDIDSGRVLHVATPVLLTSVGRVGVVNVGDDAQSVLPSSAIVTTVVTVPVSAMSTRTDLISNNE